MRVGGQCTRGIGGPKINDFIVCDASHLQDTRADEVACTRSKLSRCLAFANRTVVPSDILAGVLQLLGSHLIFQQPFVEAAIESLMVALKFGPVVLITHEVGRTRSTSKVSCEQLVYAERTRPWGLITTCPVEDCKRSALGVQVNKHKNGYRLDCKRCHKRVGQLLKPDFVDIYGDGKVVKMPFPQPYIVLEWQPVNVNSHPASIPLLKEGSNGDVEMS
jgi:hypothetical protein